MVDPVCRLIVHQTHISQLLSRLYLIDVIVAKVKKVMRPDYTSTVYKVKVKKELKATQKAAILLKSGRLVTSGMSSMCGVDLTLEETYLIAGHVSAGQARISLCSFIQPWRETSIVNCPWWRDCKDKAQMLVNGEKNSSKNLCQWKTSLSSHQTLPDCQGMHSICMKLPGGGCGWTNDRQYNACMKTRRRMRDEQLAKEP
uniref:NTR domain-containing protein n=1 Tax=Timema cristinae TaxID=61476 RepID=A0A7R9D2I0_TIMCR|nr:unnamed protein product [Timema cristinae]